MGPARAPPAERVRARLRALAGEEVARALPGGYQRLGRVLLVRLPAELAPYGPFLGEAWRRELGVTTVLARAGPIDGELREPRVVRLSDGPTETTVVEHGTRWSLDAARLMFAAGNRVERQRFAGLVRPAERVADLFAGIGYFTVPAARANPTASFVAVEKNPVAYAYLERNVRENGVAGSVRTVLGDNRRAALAARAFDRVVLGYLPSSVPYLDRAVELLAPQGGSLHAHLVADARDAVPRAEAAVRAELERGGAVVLGPPRGREVKPYGPGRAHVVVDVAVRPPV
jgi:tRNA wybutosine-synthesizing protein 2